jgi:hypothetical protein
MTGHWPRKRRHALVVDHDQCVLAHDDRTFLGEIKQHHPNAFGRDVLPDVELRILKVAFSGARQKLFLKFHFLEQQVRHQPAKA